MTDGDIHPPLKRAVAAALASTDAEEVAALSRKWARTLWERDEAATVMSRATALAFGLSTHVIGRLLGVPPTQLGQVASWVGDLVRCLAPSSSPLQVAWGIEAAEQLAGLMTGLLHERNDGRPNRLLVALRREIGGEGIADALVVVANGVGFLSQAYEATAGLVGNSLLALAMDSIGCRMTVADPTRTRAVVRDALRRDPSVQNTRRFVDRDGEIAGQEVRRGDAILVLLAAANNDPMTCVAADRLDGEHGAGCGYGFGFGPHACPGGAIALTIAAAAVRQVVASGVDLAQLALPCSYRPSANARIPAFGAGEGSA